MSDTSPPTAYTGSHNPFDDPRMLGPNRRTDARHRITASATVSGIDNPRNSRMTLHGSPLPTSSPNRLAMYCSSSSEVSAVSAKRSGPKCSLRTYLWSIFTG